MPHHHSLPASFQIEIHMHKAIIDPYSISLPYIIIQPHPSQLLLDHLSLRFDLSKENLLIQQLKELQSICLNDTQH